VPTQIILLAEDREDDIELILRAFAAAQINNPLFVVRNGEEAIAYLKGEGKYARRDEFPLPSLLILDLKMPRIDGFEVIKWIRAQPGLSPLRIIVLTSSDAIRDVNTAYRLGANSFMVKPMDFNDTVQMGRFLTEYWLNTSKAPETTREPRKPSNI
jgi:CheY-like chemotaxis protein